MLTLPEEMKMKTGIVNLTEDHIDRVSRVSLYSAIEELIWNGLDSGSTTVNFITDYNDLSGARSIIVEDQGSGIKYSEVKRLFEFFGDSTKVQKIKTDDGRYLHGSEGRGRYKAFALGNQIKWNTIYKEDLSLHQFDICISRAAIKKVTYSDLKPISSGTTGTTVVIDQLNHDVEKLTDDDVVAFLREKFTIYLKQYPNVIINYNSHRITIENLIEDISTYPLDPISEKGNSPKLEIIEWNFSARARKLHLCDEKGFSRREINAGIHAPGYEFSAYLLANEVEALYHSGNIDLDLDEDTNKLIESSKKKLREHFKKKDEEHRNRIIDGWKSDGIYPYKDSEDQTPLKAMEKKVFDMIAMRVHEQHEAFRTGDNKSKNFTLTLMRQALESGPTTLNRLLQEVLSLSPEQIEDLSELIKRTNFESIIRAAKRVTERLDIIQAFDEILFDKDWKKRLLERTQLHRLLVHNLWIFGEEYELDTDDESLVKVLEKHKKHLKREFLTEDKDVRTIDGIAAIPDLMFSRRFCRRPDIFEHLVVELKRPSLKLGQEEISQIEGIGHSVANDERFSKEKVKWKFILLGNEFNDFAESKAKSINTPYGCLHIKQNLEIWIMKWNDILQNAKMRYEFFRNTLVPT